MFYLGMYCKMMSSSSSSHSPHKHLGSIFLRPGSPMCYSPVAGFFPGHIVLILSWQSCTQCPSKQRPAAAFSCMSPSPHEHCPSARKSRVRWGWADHGCTVGEARRAAALIGPDGGKWRAMGFAGQRTERSMPSLGSRPGLLVAKAPAAGCQALAGILLPVFCALSKTILTPRSMNNLQIIHSFLDET